MIVKHLLEHITQMIYIPKLYDNKFYLLFLYVEYTGKYGVYPYCHPYHLSIKEKI